MKKPGEQPQSDARDDTDPRNHGSRRAAIRKIGAAVTAGAVAVSIGYAAREAKEPQRVHGVAEMSADALKDPVIYFKSDVRNEGITDKVNSYSDRIMEDMNNHPERTKFVEDSPTEDNDDNVKGHGSFVETVKVNNDTYKFMLPGSHHGSVIDDGELIMSRSTVENGRPVQQEVQFVQRSSGEPWSTRIDDSIYGRYDGTPAQVNFDAAERPHQTGQHLQESDNNVLMTAEQYLAAARIAT